MPDAVAWHSQIAHKFNAKYRHSRQFRERLAIWEQLIRTYAGPDSDVLDAGCGSGVLSELAARCARAVLSFDASAEMVALAQMRRQSAGLDNLTVCIGEIGGTSSMPLDSRFDLILCSSVLEYIDDYWQAVDWLAAALKPAGVLIFSLPNGASLYRKVERVVYRLSGRPPYYAHVRHVPHVQLVCAGLAARSMRTLDVKYYASVPLISPVITACGRSDLAANLFAVVCRFES